VAGSPADQAGIPQGAVITEVDGTATGSPDTLHAAIRRHKAGEQMRVAWVDTNGKHSATVTLATSLGA
jgi:putative serine protease PepD